MKLATFQPANSNQPVSGEIRDGHAIAFTDGSSVIDRATNGDLTPANGERYPLDEVELLAPIPKPTAIFGIGLNYASHAEETGLGKPETPVVFLKLPGSVAPPAGPIRCPQAVKRLDYEGELCVVMGSDNKPFGYAVANDVSARDLQRREPQWVRAKGADTFCPYGPWITTTDELADPNNLKIQTWVNGELRQDANTSEMLYKIDELIAFISETSTLNPGDLILTGTPSGVGMAMEPRTFLQAGDVVRIEIEGLGGIEQGVA